MNASRAGTVVPLIIAVALVMLLTTRIGSVYTVSGASKNDIGKICALHNCDGAVTMGPVRGIETVGGLVGVGQLLLALTFLSRGVSTNRTLTALAASSILAIALVVGLDDGALLKQKYGLTGVVERELVPALIVILFLAVASSSLVAVGISSALKTGVGPGEQADVSDH